MNRCYIILTLIILVIHTTNAQIRIEGKLIDENNTGIPFVSILIPEENTFTYGLHDGSFIIELPNAGSYRFQFKHVSFNTIDTIINITSQQTIRIEMKYAPIRLDEIMVSAEHQPRFGINESIDFDKLQKNNPRTLPATFESVPGFALIKRGAYAMDPVLRSFKYEQLNVIYDGGVLVSHACPNRMDPAVTHITPEEIDKIEILKGPYSVRYGQSMGAIINMVTKSSPRSDKLIAGGEISSGYQTNGGNKYGQLNVFATDRKFDVVAKTGIKDFGNYVNGDGEEIPSSFKMADYSLKAGWNISGKDRLQLSWRQVYAKDVKHASLPMDADKDNSSILSLDYGRNLTGSKLFSIQTKAYATMVDHEMSNRARPNIKMVEAVSPVSSESLGGKIELGWRPTNKDKIFNGLDFRYMGKDGVRNRKVFINPMNGQPFDSPKEFVDKIWQDSDWKNLGTFAEWNHNISNSLNIVVGTRIDWVSSQINDPEDDFKELYGDLDVDNELNLSLSGILNYATSEKWDLQLAIGHGTRSASLTERYINHFQIGMDAYEYVGNPFLKPEKNLQTDLSATGKFAGWWVKGNVFASYMKDYITAKVDTTLHRKFTPTQEPIYAKGFVNINEAFQTGFEFGLGYLITKDFSITGTTTYTYAQNLDWNEPLSQIAPLSAWVDLKWEKERYWALLSGRFAADQDRVAPSFNESPSPGYSVYDFRGGAEIFRNVYLDISVLNILNRNYFQHLSRPYKNQEEMGLFYEPGRNFIVGLRLKI